MLAAGLGGGGLLFGGHYALAALPGAKEGEERNTVVFSWCAERVGRRRGRGEAEEGACRWPRAPARAMLIQFRLFRGRGNGLFGQLGNGGQTEAVWEPTAVERLLSEDVVEIAAAYHSTAVVTAGGEVFTFGCGSDARLGHGWAIDLPNDTTPRKIEGLGGAAQAPRVGVAAPAAPASALTVYFCRHPPHCGGREAHGGHRRGRSALDVGRAPFRPAGPQVRLAASPMRKGADGR